MAFTKLSSSLIASSVWNEPDNVRIVWITMLAMADQNGDVKSSLPGLAHLARKTLEETKSALAVLSAPDPHSGRKELNGRRVTEIEGGWNLVTHPYYRELGMSDEMKRYWREKQREHRLSLTVKDSKRQSKMSCSVSVPASVNGEGDLKGKGKPSLIPTAEDIYQAYPRHESKPDAIRAIDKAIRAGFGRAFLLERTIAYAKTQPPRSRFTPLPATWFNAQRFNDDPQEWERDEGKPSNRPKKPWEVAKARPKYDDLYPT